MNRLDVRKIPAPILIVSPHPDDDILGCGGLIQSAIRLQKTIYVLFVTNGDANTQSLREVLRKPVRPASYRDMAYVRHAEAVEAQKFLGVPKSNLFFLGFPDGILYDIAEDTNYFRLHRSPYTCLSQAIYPFSYRRNAPYNRATAVSLMTSVLRRVNPKTVVVNLDADIHPDHKASSMLMLEAIRKQGIRPKVYSSLIHYPNWPKKSWQTLHAPKGLYRQGLTTLPLTSNERLRTRRAYNIHRSQTPLIASIYNLIRDNELFWTTPIVCDKPKNSRGC